MKEKGQVWIIFAGLLFLAVIFFAGWLAHQWWGKSNGPEISPDLVTISLGEGKDGESDFSTITMDNCKSDVESIAYESREFAYQHIFDIDSHGDVELTVKDAIVTRLSKDFGFQVGETFKVTRSFEFPSIPRKITIHTIEFKRKLRTGTAVVNGKEYRFTYLEDVEVSTTSEQRSCP